MLYVIRFFTLWIKSKCLKSSDRISRNSMSKISVSRIALLKKLALTLIFKAKSLEALNMLNVKKVTYCAEVEGAHSGGRTVHLFV